jgi:hypothetical protein
MLPRRGPVRALGGALLLLACGAGCGAPRGYERYVPPSDAARRALQAALDAWRDGGGPEALAARSPGVVVVDNQRRPGQALRGYEVLGELPGDGPRRFAVRLRLDDPPAEEKARFLVVGVDPLWVFRQEDYDMLAHWECGMTTEKEGEAAAGPVPPPPAETVHE